ncbi:MAG TPA: Ig-like domain-containing protein, partial [Thermoanaerobaculia bacterium]|nr:Ig-like domain-containing protein [Thermoanaerobaculia bacterium]
VTLAASQTWNIGSYPAADLVLNGTVNLNGYALTVGGTKNVAQFNGDVVGSGAINISGGFDTGWVEFNGHVSINGPITDLLGMAKFTATNTFAGPVKLVSTFTGDNHWQSFDMSAPAAFPSGCQVIFSDATWGVLSLGPNVLTQPSLSGTGAIILNGGTVNLTNAPNTTLHGYIAGSGSLNVTGGNQTLLYFAGASATTLTTTVTNHATLFLDGANIVAGTTSVGPGTLKLHSSHLDALNASGGTLSLLVGNFATSLTLSSTSNFMAVLASGKPISVSGNVSLGSSSLSLTPEAQPQAGATYTLIANTGSGSTAGTFAGYPEGATFTLNGMTYSITYHGGSSGKDVVITVIGPAKAATQTLLATSPNPSQHNQPVTLAATVSSVSGAPTGTVTFYDGSTPLQAVTLNNGRATYTTAALGVGVHSLTAQYGGDSAFSPSTSNAVSQTVRGGAPTLTSLTTSNGTTEVGEPVEFRAFVQSSASAPSGSVVFTDGGIPIGAATLDANGLASFTTSALGAGVHAIVATFQASDAFSGSFSALVTQTVLADCPFPIFASTLADAMVAPHSDVTLSVTTATGQQEQFAWFSGSYPDTSQPLGVTSPALTLFNLESSARVWVRVTNSCGSVYSSALIGVPTPPRRRAIPH